MEKASQGFVRTTVILLALCVLPIARAEEGIQEAAKTLDLVILSMGLNILIAGTLLWFTLKHRDNYPQNRLFLSVIALLFLANGVHFASESLVQLKGSTLSEQSIVFLSNVVSAMDFYTALTFPLIFILFPSPLFTQRKHMIAAGVTAAAIYLLFLTFIVFAIVPIMVVIVVLNVLMILTFLIPIRWYLLYRDSPILYERNHAIAAGLLGVGILVSQGMFAWSSIFIYGGESLVAGISGQVAASSGGEVSWALVFSHARTIGPMMFLLYMVYKEVVVPKNYVSKPLRFVVIAVFFVGMLNALVNGLVDDPNLSSLWEFFAIRGTYGLVRPLIMVYLLLKFNLIDMRNADVRKVARLVALVLISVWVAMVFEIFQAFLPIPQLLSAAIIGVVLAFLIGWEDRMFENVAKVSDDTQLMIVDEFIEPDDVSRFITVGLLTMVLGCFLSFINSGLLL